MRSTDDRRAGAAAASWWRSGAADCQAATMRRADSVASWRATPSSARTGWPPDSISLASTVGPSEPVTWAAVSWGAEPLRRTRGVPRSRRTVVRDGAAPAPPAAVGAARLVPADVAALGPQGGRHPAQLGQPRPVGHVGRHRQVALVLQGVVDEAGQAPRADLDEGPDALGVEAAGEGAEAHRLQQVAEDEVADGGGVVGEGADGGGRPHRHRRAGGSGGGRTSPAPGRGRGRASASGSRT